jgi:riboflavin synthase
VFTGLIAGVGTVERVEAGPEGATLRIATPLAAELGEGDSVAVTGVCLTAREIDAEGFSADAIAETLRRSTLGGLAPGARVNLELSLRAGERLGGHVVQGHVDATGTVASVEEEGFSRVLRVSVPDALARYMVEKGSVALDGVSLTVSSLNDEEGCFDVSLIPETLRRTTLGALAEGSAVNIEVDVLAKHVERLLAARALGGHA